MHLSGPRIPAAAAALRLRPRRKPLGCRALLASQAIVARPCLPTLPIPRTIRKGILGRRLPHSGGRCLHTPRSLPQPRAADLPIARTSSATAACPISRGTSRHTYVVQRGRCGPGALRGTRAEGDRARRARFDPAGGAGVRVGRVLMTGECGFGQSKALTRQTHT